ncbi:MAG: DinB family protein [Chitinophagaceae bacterium]
MEHSFQILDIIQQQFTGLLDGLSMEQLNQVPEGFNNNLAWNFGHIIASLQMLCYARTGLPVRLDESFVHAYKVGTRPETVITDEAWAGMKQLAAEGLEQLRADYRNGYFSDFKPYTTRTGIAVGSIEFAIQYTACHHGMHHGYAMALKRALA